MRARWESVMRALRHFLGYLWRYSGTLAFLSLLLGVLGMGVYHQFVARPGIAFRNERLLRYYTGLLNTAGPEDPVGLGEIVADTAPSTPCICFEYARDGSVVAVRSLDAAGNPALLPGSRVASQLITRDAAGRIVRKQNTDAAGQPAPDAHGVAAREFQYDAAGRLIRAVTQNAQGEAVVPPMPGYAVKTLSYDAQNRPTRIQYADGAGTPVINARGESVVLYRYDDAQGASQRINTVQGRVADNKNGIATEHHYADESGSFTHTEWKSAHGEPVLHPEQCAASVIAEHTADGKSVSTRRFDTQGKPLQSTPTWAEHQVQRDEAGRVAWERYTTANGKPCVEPALGYAERVCMYDAAGAPHRELFRDAAGAPSACYEKRYINSGGSRYVLCLHADGATELKPCR
ncbi:MAG: hypothetical protein E7033_03535 [Akkermansiaceae bacterium]|nr:hypothetical protein [Akkermansiaceae bacterium]